VAGNDHPDFSKPVMVGCILGLPDAENHLDSILGRLVPFCTAGTLGAGATWLLPRQERSSQTGNHGTTPPYGRELPPGRTRKGEVDSDSLFRVFRWIPWLISDSS
jgi:hypothetical protein